MKEGYGDILYLLALVAFFVFSSIMKSRKAKKNMPAQPAQGEHNSWETEQEDSSSDYNDIFETQQSTTITEMAAAPVVAETRSDIVREREKITKQMFGVQQPVATNPDNKNMNPLKESDFAYSEVDGTHDADSYWDNEEFDLKKAIVFSEILRRPEL